jgi:hypothetical protein
LTQPVEELFDEKACLNETPSGCWETPHATDIYHARELKARRNQPSLNFSPIEKIKAALRGIKVVSSISYAKGEERPYGNRVYNRTNGISATGAAPSDRAI